MGFWGFKGNVFLLVVWILDGSFPDFPGKSDSMGIVQMEGARILVVKVKPRCDYQYIPRVKKKEKTCPDAPCMDYLPTLGEKWLHSRGNAGKYSLHGAFGMGYSLPPSTGGGSFPIFSLHQREKQKVPGFFRPAHQLCGQVEGLFQEKHLGRTQQPAASEQPSLPEDPGDELDPVMRLGKSIFIRVNCNGQWIVETLQLVFELTVPMLFEKCMSPENCQLSSWTHRAWQEGTSRWLQHITDDATLKKKLPKKWADLPKKRNGERHPCNGQLVAAVGAAAQHLHHNKPRTCEGGDNINPLSAEQHQFQGRRDSLECGDRISWKNPTFYLDLSKAEFFVGILPMGFFTLDV